MLKEKPLDYATATAGIDGEGAGGATSQRS